MILGILAEAENMQSSETTDVQLEVLAFALVCYGLAPCMIIYKDENT